MPQAPARTAQSSIIIFVLVIAAGLGIALGNRQKDEGKSTPVQNDTQEQITLELSFSPPFRKDRSIKVEAFVEGVDALQVEGEDAKFPGLSGWSRTFPIPKGAEVRFSGWAKYGTFFQCLIRSNGREVSKDDADLINKFQVDCVHNKKR